MEYTDWRCTQIWLIQTLPSHPSLSPRNYVTLQWQWLWPTYSCHALQSPLMCSQQDLSLRQVLVNTEPFVFRTTACNLIHHTTWLCAFTLTWITRFTWLKLCTPTCHKLHKLPCSLCLLLSGRVCLKSPHTALHQCTFYTSTSPNT